MNFVNLLADYVFCGDESCALCMFAIALCACLQYCLRFFPWSVGRGMNSFAFDLTAQISDDWRTLIQHMSRVDHD